MDMDEARTHMDEERAHNEARALRVRRERAIAEHLGIMLEDVDIDPRSGAVTVPAFAVLPEVEEVRSVEQLRDVAKRIGVRSDWYAPDEQCVTAEVRGTAFDNTGFWGANVGGPLLMDQAAEELHVVLLADGIEVAVVNLATLFAWACKSKDLLPYHIVHALANEDGSTFVDYDRECRLCSAYGVSNFRDATQHRPDCAWRQAVEWKERNG